MENNNGFEDVEKSDINSDELVENAIQKMEAQHEDKQRGIFGQSVQESGENTNKKFPEDPPMRWPTDAEVQIDAEVQKKPDLKVVSNK